MFSILPRVTEADGLRMTTFEARRLCILGNVQSVHVRRWACAMSGQGWRVTVIGPYAIEESAFKSMAWSSRHGNALSRMAGWPGQLKELRSLLMDGSFDVVWIHGVGQGIRMALVPRKLPTVVTVYGSDVIPREGQSPERFATHLAARVLRVARVITAASPYLAGFTEERFAHTVGKMAVVPFGVDTELFRPSAGPPNGVPRLVFAKSMRSIYGLHVLIRAAAILAERGARFEVVVAGPGDPERYQRQAADLGVASRVQFVGQLGHSELAGLLKQATLFVMPTVVRESFGVAAVEALASGVPVVASRIGAIPDVVADGETGLLFEPGDAEDLADKIGVLLQNSEMRSSMGAKGREHVLAHYDWRECVKTMDEVLVGVLRIRNRG